MLFHEAWDAMKRGQRVKREKWGGYWELDDGKIVMHCFDGQRLDIRDTKDTVFTFDNVAADDWILATPENINICNGKKAMLSQPMRGKPEEEIEGTREKAIEELEDRGFEIVNTLFTDEWYKEQEQRAADRGVVNRPLYFLANSLVAMSKCHAVYFCKGWEKARGCLIEHDAAQAYGLEIIYEKGAEPRMEMDEDDDW